MTTLSFWPDLSANNQSIGSELRLPRLQNTSLAVTDIYIQPATSSSKGSSKCNPQTADARVILENLRRLRDTSLPESMRAEAIRNTGSLPFGIDSYRGGIGESLARRTALAWAMATLDPSRLVRVTAAETLMAQGYPALRFMLERIFTYYQDPQQPRAALIILENIQTLTNRIPACLLTPPSGPSSSDRLSQILEYGLRSADPRERAGAIIAFTQLGWIRRHGPALLLDYINTDQAASVRMVALEQLYYLQEEQAMPGLDALFEAILLRCPHPEIRQRVIEHQAARQALEQR